MIGIPTFVYSSLLVTFMCNFNQATAANYGWFTILRMEEKPISPQDIYFMKNKNDERTETVDLQLYYETLCPYCIQLESTQFKNVVNTLSPYLNIKTYPYGNAQTIETNGSIEFKCQHGPKECYGNKLHACSLKHITNHTDALNFNICMMETNDKTRGSDDAAVLKCADEMNIDKSQILQCARGKEGGQLLKYYGEESQKANFNYVPYVLINGVEWLQNGTLMQDVCAAFKDPPEVCNQ